MQAAPRIDPPGDAARLRDVLDRAGYDAETILSRFSLRDISSMPHQDRPYFLSCTRGDAPLDTLIRLFLIGVPVEAEAVRRAVRPMPLEDWARMGLIDVQGAHVVGRVQWAPCEGLLIASDRPECIRSGQADAVMGIGASSMLLARARVQGHGRATLDLGTGSGILAFLAAAHSDRVVAVDSNRRAVAMAAFNARMNGLDHVACREGDLFEPVRGERFDLVLSNPPFVVSPETRYVYRDSALGLDGVTRAIVRGVADVLAEGGICQMLTNWAHVAGEDWRDRLAGWSQGTGCDAWVLPLDSLDPPAYAAKWIRHTEVDDAQGFARRYDAWMAYYERERVEAVTGGLVILRRRDGRNWFHVADGSTEVTSGAGEGIVRAFEAQDFLRTDGAGGGLLEARLRRAPDVRLEQTARAEGAGWAVEDARLVLESGLRATGRVDAHTATLVAGCDGSRPLRELVSDLAGALGRDVADVAPAVLDAVRGLVTSGFLLPGARQ